MTATVKFDDMLKAQQWERCKGELRAMVALQGSYSTSGRPPNADPAIETDTWQELKDYVESFIHDVESNALHE